MSMKAKDLLLYPACFFMDTFHFILQVLKLLCRYFGNQLCRSCKSLHTKSLFHLLCLRLKTYNSQTKLSGIWRNLLNIKSFQIRCICCKPGIYLVTCHIPVDTSNQYCCQLCSGKIHWNIQSDPGCQRSFLLLDLNNSCTVLCKTLPVFQDLPGCLQYFFLILNDFLLLLPPDQRLAGQWSQHRFLLLWKFIQNHNCLVT